MLVEREAVAWPLKGGPPVEAERWRLEVPTRWEEPDGPHIVLDVVRLLNRAARPGPPIVVLAGGPGASGVQDLRDQWPVDHGWIRRALERHDVIAWDQRGVGTSQPKTSCDLSWDLPLDQPGERTSMLEVTLRRARECRDGCESRGVDLGALTTAQSVQDIDAIRLALGAEQVALIGASYGSHLGLAAVRELDDRVCVAILALVEPMDHTYKLPSAVDAAFDRVDGLLAADDRWQMNPGDLRAMTLDALELLDRKSPSVRTGDGTMVRLGSWDAQLAVADSLGSAKRIAVLPDRLLALRNGRFEWLAEAAAQWRTEPFDSAMTWHMDAASGASDERLARIRHERETALLSDAMTFPFPEMASVWGSPDLGAAFRAPFGSSTPLLFVSGGLDGRTPASNVDEIVPGFPHGAHAIVEGLAHGPVLKVPEVAECMLRCLDGEEPRPFHTSIPFEFAPRGRP